MSSQTQPRYTVPEYLEIERGGAERHEYFAGEIFAMGGASERHNIIVANLVGELRQQLKSRPCRVYPNDMRVRVSATGLYTYPDVVVACGQTRFDDEQRDTLLNPTLLIEVLSASTEAYDRGRKSEQYRQLESLREYLLVAQDHFLVEHYQRQLDGRWLLSEFKSPGDTILLAAIECRLPLIEVYDKVEFDR